MTSPGAEELKAAAFARGSRLILVKIGGTKFSDPAATRSL
ncbi:hypothetical protein ANO14919_022330 [Xylariales sp. No.14919]|nr:hypothetical protein ANO14919_022330 [Xylariales sp. No.14919]